MAEDDEIDILGDFSLDNFLTKNDSGIYENNSLVSQNSELLNCDYTIHPQWLLDKPSANPDCWYDTGAVLSTGLSDKTTTDLCNDNDNLGHVSTENAITDESGWTEKEKNLLDRGIEIFGKSNMRLSQFIGSRTPSEVKYFLKNFYMEGQVTYTGLNTGTVEDINIANNLVSDYLDETQIPASIEEVIAAVSTAKPTIPVKQSRKKSSSFNSNEDDETSYKDIPDGSHSKQNPKSNSDEKNNKIEAKRKVKNKMKKAVKFKIKTNLKFPMDKVVKQKTVKIMNQENKKTEIGRVEITTGKGLAVPICEGEEIVKISKDDSDSDVLIDVEDPDETKTDIIKDTVKEKQVALTTTTDNGDLKGNDSCHDSTNRNKHRKHYIDLTMLHERIVRELTTMNKPKSEVVINENFISELEKVVHNEFFEDRPTKTPLRYLRIRNHIIQCWLSIKPSYVTKTSIRQGLKNCGDVSCISRIHCYLEQIGAINFGCPQTIYVRPLIDVFQSFASTPRERPPKENKQKNDVELGSRQRNKRKLGHDGEGGCTLTHNEKGDVINTTIVNEEPPKPKVYTKKPSIRLIYCRPFPEMFPQKYKVKLHLTTLLLMDFHAHTSLTEVMGLIAGTWSPSKNVLTISHYEPCRNIASSATHCDMCPVSQSRAVESIHSQNLDILGWFHSHPTFAPEPSQQDLDTQQDVQLWMGSKTPCLGVILSPFSAHGALIASPFRCMVVDKKENFEDQFVPYKFQVEIVPNENDVNQFFVDLNRIFRAPVGNKERKIDFGHPYFQDVSISYLEKYITSVRMHLAKCGTVNKMTCDYIIENINKICSK